MSETAEKLCPFDKKECIRIRCAIWSFDEEICALALIPRTARRQSGQVKQGEKYQSSGLSGKYRDPLFD